MWPLDFECLVEGLASLSRGAVDGGDEFDVVALDGQAADAGADRPDAE